MRTEFAMQQNGRAQLARFIAAKAVESDADAADRSISFIFSDESVARDNHTIATNGWVLDNFRANPVCLWCHDSSAPPVGRVTDISTKGQRLLGNVVFADAEIYEFADTVFRLYKGRFLNAVSVSWAPLEWTWTQDKSRPGGIDFKRQEMLEVSAVPVPALPTALATARSQGIDTRPLVEWAERILDSGQSILVPRAELEQLRRDAQEPKSMTTKTGGAPAPKWKVTASRTLPLALDAGAPINSGAFLALADDKLARKAFLVCSEDGAEKRFAIATVQGGRLMASAGAVRAASKELEASDLPDDIKAEARSVLAVYEAKMPATGARALGKRGLGTVSWLAYLLSDLGYIQECVAYEAEHEGDGSPIPGQLAAALKTLGQILVDMTAEEVAELVANSAAPDADEAEEVTDARSAFRAIRRAFSDRPDLLVGFAPILRDAANGAPVFVRAATTQELALQRAGKVLSDANCRALEDIHGAAESVRCMVREFIDSNTPVAEERGAPEPAALAATGQPAAPEPANDDDALKRRRAAAAAKARHQFEAAGA